MEAVASVIDVFQNVFCSPWSRDAVNLISLSTGLSATPEVKDDLMLILEGKAHVENFCKNDFFNGTVSFFNPLRNCKLKYLKNLKTVRKVRSNDAVIPIKLDRVLFARMT